MGSGWRKEIRGDFGWYVEGKRKIKAFWLPEAEFEDPTSKVKGNIATATAQVLMRGFETHSSELEVSSDFEAALKAGGYVKAFGVAEGLGSGFMVVLPAGLSEFYTVGFERAQKKASFWNKIFGGKGASSQIGKNTDYSALVGALLERTQSLDLDAFLILAKRNGHEVDTDRIENENGDTFRRIELKHSSGRILVLGEPAQGQQFTLNLVVSSQHTPLRIVQLMIHGKRCHQVLKG